MIRMSFSKTIPQVRQQQKDVTRRTGWWDHDEDKPRVNPGDMIIAIEKGMGLKKGARQVVICPIEVVSIRREPLGAITDDDIAREGFPGMARWDFVHDLFGGAYEDVITRIEFTYKLHDHNAIDFKIGKRRMDALFREALGGFVTKKPPRWARAWAERIGDGSGADRLQSWVVWHLRSRWMTGIGAIEAAEHMLTCSLENGNLNDEAWVDEGVAT